jgi:putative intracellular protease/amidase
MNNSSAIKPILFVVTSHGVKGNTGIPTGFWLSEVTHPLEVLQAAGHQVEFASIQGGQPPIDGLDLTDATNARYWADPAFREAIANTRRIDDVDASRYSAVFFAGGHGTMWDFPDSPGAHKVIRQIYESGGIVSAVCHGPAVLVNATLSDGKFLVDGKNVASFTNDEERAVEATDIVPFLLATALSSHGAIHHAAPVWRRNVVVDGHLVTGQNPASAGGVGEAVRDLVAKATPPRQ